jgi:DNA polymerase-3 subunit delta'
VIEFDPRSQRLAAHAPWLAAAREQMRAALLAGRLPHALLLQGPPGIGKAALADYLARQVLCDRPEQAPCGECAGCHLYDAGSHPDLRRVGLVEDKKQIAVDDIRELIAGFVLRSFRGGRKVAIIDPADAMNVNGANALLKTLEEPTEGALLILTVARPDRLPATIASRCQRLSIRTPDQAVALEWLKAFDAGVDWPPLLALAAGAPIGALELARAGAEKLEERMKGLPARLANPDTDLVALAEECHGDLPAERLRWIENWVTDRIRRGLQPPAPGHSPSNTGLPSAARTRHIQGLYATLDELRTAQAAMRGPANLNLLWERVLGGLARELASVRAAQGR